MSTDLRSLFDAIQRGDTHEITSHLFPSPSSSDGQHGRKSAVCGAQQELSAEERPTAGIGTADAGPPYKLECRARYYDAASRILEEEGQLWTHDNTNELGALIEQWINDARDNWEPR